MPRSLKGHSTIARSRVYLVDFETAIDLPEDSVPSERLVSGLPYLPGFSGTYSRPTPQGLDINVPHCPFKMDIWQFGYLLHKECSAQIPISCSQLIKLTKIYIDRNTRTWPALVWLGLANSTRQGIGQRCYGKTGRLCTTTITNLPKYFATPSPRDGFSVLVASLTKFLYFWNIIIFPSHRRDYII